MNAASSGGDPGPFLHLKFGVGRPPPHEHEVHEGGSAPQLLLFAHEIELDPATHSRNLHETLRTDVQRAGIARWLEQNFKEDAYIYDVVHRREGDRGMFALVTKNWARSVGDPKLHLSLYVYQDHMHVATWHAYSDRSVSYSRAGDENAPSPEGSDPYSTPEALEAAASAALPTSSSSSKEQDDDGRPRFDRPAALPTDSSDLEDTDEVPFKPEVVVVAVQPSPVKKSTRSARGARKPQPPPPEPDLDSDGSSQEEEEKRPSKKPSRLPAPKSDSESESDRSSDAASRSRSPSLSPSPPPPQPSRRSTRRTPRPPPSDAESPSSADEADGPAYPIVKSQPLGKSRSDRHEAKSPPPPPPASKKKSERGRDRTPVSPVAQSPSPPPAASRKGETDRLAQQQRERSRRRARPAAAPEPEPEPSPPTSRSQSRSPPSPVRDPRSERGRRSARNVALASEGEQESEKPIADVRGRDRSARRPKPPRSPSPTPSQSETPPTKLKRLTPKPVVEAKKDRVYERASRSESRSPSPPVRPAKTQSKRSTRQDSEVETRKSEDERPHRGRSRAPVEPTALPQLDRKPSWRSVSRNRHRRNGSDSSGDDTLVRGNLVDADLDIPAGGEATLLTAKRRASISEHSAGRPSRPRRDDSFDPEEVQQPPRAVVEAPKPQTATAVLGSWIKSVGTLLKPEVELTSTATATAADSEAEELEARLRRKAERAERRKARAARRAARQTDASAFEDTEADRTASELERTERSSRRRPQEDEPRRSRRHPETEEPVSKPARPALRERAMSFSATLDSGLKNLRESVNKIVSGADEPPDSASSAESEVIDRRRSRHRAHSRKRRENPEEESGPEHQRRRRMNVEELSEQRQSRDGLVEERRSRSERPESTDAQRKLRERSRRREIDQEDRQDDPTTRPKSALVNSPSDEDDALLLQRRTKESARVRDKSAIDEDASGLPIRSSSSRAAAAESSSRAARPTRQPPRVDDSSSSERPSSRRAPRSDAVSRPQAEITKDREDAVAAERTTSRSARSFFATADAGPANLDMRAQYVDRNVAPDRERPRQDYEKERRGPNSVLRPRHSSSARQSTLKPPQPGDDDCLDEPRPRRRQVGQVALDDAAPVEQVGSSSSLPSAAFSPSPSPSTSSRSTATDFTQQRRSRPSTSRPADADHSRGGHHPGRDNLTDEEEESRFVAARGSSSTASPISDRRTPSRTTVTRERDEGEYIPPIPAPAPLSTRSSLPEYDSGPLRPQPHRAAEQPSFGGGAGGVPGSHSHSDPAWDGKRRDSSSRASTTKSHLLQHHDLSLPRTAFFSRRSQAAFDPAVSAASSSVADSDADSDLDSPEEEDGEATSDPDSVAIRRRRRRHDQSDRQLGQMGDWNDSRGRSAPSRRFEGVAEDGDDGTLRARDGARPRQGDEGVARPGRGGGGGDYDSDDYDYDGEGSLFQQSAAATPLSNRSAPTASSLSPSAMNRRFGDAAPSSSAAASSSSSRTNMFGAALNPPSRTSTKSRTMVSPRPPPSSRVSGYPTAAAALETVDRGGGWRDLQQSGSHCNPRHGQVGLGLGSLSPPDQGGGACASFERLTAKGRESGSVQLFGRHNAPVSRRMARRLGMS